jgi:hypothetical protein
MVEFGDLFDFNIRKLKRVAKNLFWVELTFVIVEFFTKTH